MDIKPKLYVPNRAEWRAWLDANHEVEKEIWLVSKASSGKPTFIYLDAVEEALCFGWIDSTAKRITPKTLHPTA
jgi:uncharacterized protein YdeI (YjbR/CyaY-like superfamily)